MFTRLSAKLLLLAVLLIIPAACSLTSNNDDGGGDRPTLIPTTFVFTTPTPLGTATIGPTATIAPTATSIAVATTRPPVSQPCVAPAGWIPYRVVAGDTVGNIAQRTGTTATQIATGNCLANANAIYVGQLLYVPNVVIIVTNTPVVVACTLPPRLTVGAQGRVVPGTSNALRTLPGRGMGSIVIGEVPGGAVFTVLSGPQCADGFYWWQINYNGVPGWTAEGQGLTYWLEPYAVQGCLQATQLQAGRTGRVTPGMGNALRSQPGTGANSVIIGQIPAGGMFRVIQGPQCANGYNWWQVIYNGVTGWTAEGDMTTYWTEPLFCVGTGASQLLPGMTARVTPGLPNRLRLTPGTDGQVITEIPGGTTISILDGPQCGIEGWIWWQVNYNGTVGWTAEGDLTSFWLEPVF